MKLTTEILVGMIEHHDYTLEEYATYYALAIKDHLSSIDWAAVNKAVIGARSKFFLKSMKKRAWQIVETAEAPSLNSARDESSDKG